MELEPFMERNGIRYILIDEIYYPDLLPDIDEQTETLNRMVRQMAENIGVNEELKARDPMRWVGLMNNIRSAVREIMQDTAY